MRFGPISRGIFELPEVILGHVNEARRWTVSEWLLDGRHLALPLEGQDAWTMETRLGCIHCGGVSAFGECRVDPADGLIECADDSCDGSLLDLWNLGGEAWLEQVAERIGRTPTREEAEQEFL